MQQRASTQFDVGGILFDQPFKIRRLGHFGMNVDNIAACLEFYTELLGFRISDPEDLSAQHPKGDAMRKAGDPNIYFTRHGTDHHSLVLLDRRVFKELAGNHAPADMTVNQMTWQVGSLKEVAGAVDWFEARNVPVLRVGRDMPGSNWHVYPYDPEGHRNELYYGMEQIGWSGTSKPRVMYDRGFEERPPLPQIPEYEEVNRIIEKGVDLSSGFRHPEKSPAKYDVDGVLLARPFKVVRHGPVRLFCRDVAALERFYIETMGLIRTEELRWNGHRCVFFRCNTEHHVLALYPIALRAELGLDANTTIMSFGVQLATYRQLRDAVPYLRERGCKFVNIPRALTPGIEYSTYVLDPAGHAIQLYHQMEQVGWGGMPKPRHDASDLLFEEWPETLSASVDAYMGEPFLGPWG